jgi:hypothetical protein
MFSMSQRRTFAGLLTAVAAFASFPSDVLADTLATPAGTIMLTISGAITNTNTDGKAQFDLEMLKALGTQEIKTSTIWTEGVQTFVGVPMSNILAAVGADGTTVSATAVNDYSVTIPVEDWVTGGPLLALERDGKPMSVRDKGPIWVVYPYDSSPDLQTEVIYSRSIWQLDRLEILP